jgi:hypothetical protein
VCFQQFENLSGLRAESFRLWLGREEFSARPCCFELLQGFEQLQEKMYPLQMCSKLPLSAGRTRLRMAASECVNPGNALGCAEKRGASSYEDAPLLARTLCRRKEQHPADFGAANGRGMGQN